MFSTMLMGGSLSEAVRMTAGPSTSFNTKMVEGTLSPAANFVFHYRSYGTSRLTNAQGLHC